MLLAAVALQQVSQACSTTPFLPTQCSACSTDFHCNPLWLWILTLAATSNIGRDQTKLLGRATNHHIHTACLRRSEPQDIPWCCTAAQVHNHKASLLLLSI